jgi:hypothetical protein
LVHPEEITGYLTGKIPFLAHLNPPEEKEATPTKDAIMQAKENYIAMSASGFNITLQYLSFLGIIWLIHRPLMLNYET